MLLESNYPFLPREFPINKDYLIIKTTALTQIKMKFILCLIFVRKNKYAAYNERKAFIYRLKSFVSFLLQASNAAD
jgi:hypothetical protein